MRLAHLLDADLARTLSPLAQALDIQALSHDSRQIGAHTLFAAWRGAHSDGHAHIGEAIAKGAVFVLCQQPPQQQVPYLLCKEPRRVLARAAQRFYAAAMAKLQLVGITGTNGKTTTAHIVAAILAAQHGHAAALGTLGVSRLADDGSLDIAAGAASLTTPEASDLCRELAVLAQAHCGGAALEVSSIALAQGRLDGLAFDVCAMTNLSHDHLDFHGDMQAYMAAKALLFTRHKKAGGKSVLNADDPHQRALVQQDSWTFSAQGAQGRAGVAARVYLTAQQPSRAGMRLQLHTPAGPLTVQSALVGRFNAENILAAATIAMAAGIGEQAIVEGIARLSYVPGRLQRVQLSADDPLVLVDYAHTPDALARALAAARALSGQGRLFCVFGCGGNRDSNKRAQMGMVSAQAADWCIVTNDNPRQEAPESIAASIVQGLRDGGASEAQLPPAGPVPSGPARYCVQLARDLAIRQAILAAAAGDTVLLAGKGHEPYQIVGEQLLPFDDREQARSSLRARQKGLLR